MGFRRPGEVVSYDGRMRLRDDSPAPEGYDTWQPKMGWGGKVMVWIILSMIAGGTVLMFLDGFGQWL